MKRKLDQILILDLEATCWEDGNWKDGRISEIIEIGICVVDIKSLDILGSKSILVKPKRGEVSEFCTKLTTLTPDQVAGGVDFRRACEIMVSEFDSPARTWASWGDYDRAQIQKDCKLNNVQYPMGERHINLKNLFAIAFKQDKEIGLPAALQACGLKLDGTLHRGDDDAKNIAKIFKHMMDKFRVNL